MTDTYKELVKKAWRLFGITQYDERDFLTTVNDTIIEKENLEEELRDLNALINRTSDIYRLALDLGRSF